MGKGKSRIFALIITAVFILTVFLSGQGTSKANPFRQQALDYFKKAKEAHSNGEYNKSAEFTQKAKQAIQKAKTYKVILKLEEEIGRWKPKFDYEKVRQAKKRVDTSYAYSYPVKLFADSTNAYFRADKLYSEAGKFKSNDVRAASNMLSMALDNYKEAATLLEMAGKSETIADKMQKRCDKWRKKAEKEVEKAQVIEQQIKSNAEAFTTYNEAIYHYYENGIIFDHKAQALQYYDAVDASNHFQSAIISYSNTVVRLERSAGETFKKNAQKLLAEAKELKEKNGEWYKPDDDSAFKSEMGRGEDDPREEAKEIYEEADDDLSEGQSLLDSDPAEAVKKLKDARDKFQDAYAKANSGKIDELTDKVAELRKKVKDKIDKLDAKGGSNSSYADNLNKAKSNYIDAGELHDKSKGARDYSISDAKDMLENAEDKLNEADRLLDNADAKRLAEETSKAADTVVSKLKEAEESGVSTNEDTQPDFDKAKDDLEKAKDIIAEATKGGQTNTDKLSEGASIISNANDTISKVLVTGNTDLYQRLLEQFGRIKNSFNDDMKKAKEKNADTNPYTKDIVTTAENIFKNAEKSKAQATEKEEENIKAAAEKMQEAVDYAEDALALALEALNFSISYTDSIALKKESAEMIRKAEESGARTNSKTIALLVSAESDREEGIAEYDKGEKVVEDGALSISVQHFNNAVIEFGHSIQNSETAMRLCNAVNMLYYMDDRCISWKSMSADSIKTAAYELGSEDGYIKQAMRFYNAGLALYELAKRLRENKNTNAVASASNAYENTLKAYSRAFVFAEEALKQNDKNSDPMIFADVDDNEEELKWVYIELGGGDDNIFEGEDGSDILLVKGGGQDETDPDGVEGVKDEHPLYRHLRINFPQLAGRVRMWREMSMDILTKCTNYGAHSNSLSKGTLQSAVDTYTSAEEIAEAATKMRDKKEASNRFEAAVYEYSSSFVTGEEALNLILNDSAQKLIDEVNKRREELISNNRISKGDDYDSHIVETRIIAEQARKNGDYAFAISKAENTIEFEKGIVAQEEAQRKYALAKAKMKTYKKVLNDFDKERKEAKMLLDKAWLHFEIEDYKTSVAASELVLAMIAEIELTKPLKKLPKYYKVRLILPKRESLWRIAEYEFIYGDPENWRLIYKHNKDKIDDPDVIFPGQVFVIPEREGESRSGYYEKE